MTEVMSMQKVKVTEVKTQFSRFRTVTPVWIHIWWWTYAQSFMWLRRGALLFFKVIHQILKSHGQKNCWRSFAGHVLYQTPALQASLSCGSMPARPQFLTSVFTHSDHVFLGFPCFPVCNRFDTGHGPLKTFNNEICRVSITTWFELPFSTGSLTGPLSPTAFVAWNSILTILLKQQSVVVVEVCVHQVSADWSMVSQRHHTIEQYIHCRGPGKCGQILPIMHSWACASANPNGCFPLKYRLNMLQ